MPQEKVIGSLLEDVFSAEEARQFRENNRRVIETETPLIEEEWAEAPDGRHYFQTIKFPLRDPDRRIVAIGGISLDATERRRAEEALSETRRTERRRIARILRHSTAGPIGYAAVIAAYPSAGQEIRDKHRLRRGTRGPGRRARACAVPSTISGARRSGRSWSRLNRW